VDIAAQVLVILVLIALNHVGEIGSAWTDMREHLETLLTPEELKGIWGHTLVYEGMEPPGGVRDQLLGSVRRLHSPHRRMWPIEESGVPRGHLQLMSVPVRGEGSDACTIFVALSPVGKPVDEHLLVTKTLYGRAAALLIPDLIAHKGYYYPNRDPKRGTKEAGSVRNCRCSQADTRPHSAQNRPRLRGIWLGG